MVWRPPDAGRCRGFGLASAAFSRPWIDGGLSCFVVVFCLFHQQDKDLTANMSIYLLGIKHGTIIEEMLHLLLLSRAWLVQVYLNNRHVCHDQGVSSPFIAYGGNAIPSEWMRFLILPILKRVEGTTILFFGRQWPWLVCCCWISCKE